MGGKSSTITSAEERILSLQVQQSSQGLTLPVVYGRARVAGNLIWYGDFTTIETKTTTRQGRRWRKTRGYFLHIRSRRHDGLMRGRD